MTLTDLIPLSHFVDKIDEIVPRDLDQSFDDWKLKQLVSIKRYSAFLLQSLTLSMFVPVYEDMYYISGIDGYNKAKQKCLFEGFELINDKLFLNEKLDWFGELKGKVEDLTHLNLPLTAQAIKKILG